MAAPWAARQKTRVPKKRKFMPRPLWKTEHIMADPNSNDSFHSRLRQATTRVVVGFSHNLGRKQAYQQHYPTRSPTHMAH
jgi:hypothetical protein